MRQLQNEELQRSNTAVVREAQKISVVLVLDNVRSGLNVGSLFRTADAFALEAIVLCGITATPPHREILKTALGATESVVWKYEENTLTALQQLKQQGFICIAIEQTDASLPLQDFEILPLQQYALVLGNEVNGVSPLALAGCDLALALPQMGIKHSLNVAVCGGIFAWTFFSALRLMSK